MVRESDAQQRSPLARLGRETRKQKASDAKQIVIETYYRIQNRDTLGSEQIINEVRDSLPTKTIIDKKTRAVKKVPIRSETTIRRFLDDEKLLIKHKKNKT